MTTEGAARFTTGAKESWISPFDRGTALSDDLSEDLSDVAFSGAGLAGVFAICAPTGAAARSSADTRQAGRSGEEGMRGLPEVAGAVRAM
ncbi:hypothetical protein CHKEEEPN_4028 [Methylorubrum podarium]|nr:hypothetical protein CHKEEEPN_4028 [Methylorubrum podarium]